MGDINPAAVIEPNKARCRESAADTTTRNEGARRPDTPDAGLPDFILPIVSRPEIDRDDAVVEIARVSVQLPHQVDRGGYKEPVLIPEAARRRSRKRVTAAVEAGVSWLAPARASLFSETVPAIPPPSRAGLAGRRC